MPTIRESFVKLAGKKVLTCGDSHNQQLLLEEMCLLHSVNEVHTVNGVLGPWIPGYAPGADRKHYYPSEFLREWGERIGIKNVDVNNNTGHRLTLDEGIENAPLGTLRGSPSNSESIKIGLGRGNVQIVRYRNGFEHWTAYLRDGGISSNETGHACAQVARLTSNRKLDLRQPDTRFKYQEPQTDEVNYFDAIAFAPEFVDSESVTAILNRTGFRGRLLTLPKWRPGHSGSLAKTDMGVGNATPGVDHYARNQLAAKIVANNVDVPSQISEMHVEMLEPIFRSLVLSRNDDAKAPMYPMQWEAKNETKICMANMKDGPFSTKCLPHDNWHTCHNNAGLCEKETHFCLPGPIGAVLRYALAALASSESWRLP
jgi:hypothetical protein